MSKFLGQELISSCCSKALALWFGCVWPLQLISLSLCHCFSYSSLLLVLEHSMQSFTQGSGHRQVSLIGMFHPFCYFTRLIVPPPCVSPGVTNSSLHASIEGKLPAIHFPNSMFLSFKILISVHNVSCLWAIIFV